MSILKKLQEEGSNLSQYNGQQPEFTSPGGTPNSNLHNAYSINGTPGLPGMPTPSELDINGITPSIAGHGNNTSGASKQTLPYVDNLPG